MAHARRAGERERRRGAASGAARGVLARATRRSKPARNRRIRRFPDGRARLASDHRHEDTALAQPPRDERDLECWVGLFVESAAGRPSVCVCVCVRVCDESQGALRFFRLLLGLQKGTTTDKVPPSHRTERDGVPAQRREPPEDDVNIATRSRSSFEVS